MKDTKENVKNNNLNKKILQIIEAVLFVLILTVSMITLSSTVKYSNLSFLRYRIYIMKTDSNKEIATRGDLVIAKREEIGNIHEGDYIVYRDGDDYYCNKVIEMKKSGNTIKTVVAEKNGIEYKFSEKDINSKVVKIIPQIGNLIYFLRTILGLILYLLILICVYILLRFTIIKNDNKHTQKSL